MPNWTCHELKVFGEREKLDEFKKWVAGDRDPWKDVYFEDGEQRTEIRPDVFNFNKLIPKPEFNPELTENENFAAWYAWSIENWDSKWNACRATLVDEGDHLIYDFNTANGSGYAILNYLKNNFQHLRMEGCIISQDEKTLWGHSGGKITKFIKQYVEICEFDEDHWLMLRYLADGVRDTLQCLSQNKYKKEATRNG